MNDRDLRACLGSVQVKLSTLLVRHQNDRLPAALTDELLRLVKTIDVALAEVKG